MLCKATESNMTQASRFGVTYQHEVPAERWQTNMGCSSRDGVVYVYGLFNMKQETVAIDRKHNEITAWWLMEPMGGSLT